MPKEKIERNKKIRELRDSGLTYREIGERMGITKQFAYQVLYRERTLVAFKKYQKHIKQLVLEHYGTKCAMCGMSETRYLTIDHINGLSEEEKTHRSNRSGHNLYLRLKRDNYPPGFQVLCFACNIEKQ